jgi:hypothetical protein
VNDIKLLKLIPEPEKKEARGFHMEKQTRRDIVKILVEIGVDPRALIYFTDRELLDLFVDEVGKFVYDVVRENKEFEEKFEKAISKIFWDDEL